MPFDPSIVPVEVIRAAQRRTLVLLIGAGISRQTGHPFPTWRGLLEIMIDYSLDKKRKYINKGEAEELRSLLDRGQFLMVAQVLRKELPDEDYFGLLVENFMRNNVKPAAIHKALLYLNSPLILTTNYDNLIEDAYAEICGKKIHEFTYLKAGAIQTSFTTDQYRDRPTLFKIHGTILDPANIILTEMDYRKLTYDQLGYRAVLSAIFITRNILMLGFSLADRELTLLLETIRHTLGYRSTSHYIFLEADRVGDVETRRLKDDLGIEVIKYKPSKKYTEVLEFVNFIVDKVNPMRTIP